MKDGVVLIIGAETQTQEHLIKVVTDSLGYRTLIAKDGKTGLEQALLLSPIAILVGEFLADFSSLEFISVLKQSSCASPIILLAADQTQEHVVEAFRQGISDYLLMPDGEEAAGETIRRVINNTVAQRERETLNKKLLMVEAIQITMTTLSHYLNNYVTGLSGDLTLLRESIQQNPHDASLVEIVQKSQTNLECIKLVMQVLFNTTSVTFTQYNDSVPMIDIKDALMRELNYIEDKNFE
jgi:response regulator of citrate/malate metabolism